MGQVALTYFPFPYVFEGRRHEGVLYKWPERCSSCDRQCESSKEKRLSLCSYGVNYYRFNDELLVAGLVVHDFPIATSARTKMLRRTSSKPTVVQVEAVRGVITRLELEAAEEIRREKNEIIRLYKESGEYKTEILHELVPHLKEHTAQLHDYRQFVSRVLQNLSVILEKRYPRMPTEEKLARASHEELAIYWAAKLMEEKLRTFLFFLEPQRLDHSKDVAFRFHGCVHKYLQIYQRSFTEKNIEVETQGESYGELVGDPVAIGVIPHTLLDNALKYSPRHSRVTVSFRETQASLSLIVASYGPRLAAGEERTIFNPFVRGQEAQRLEPDGSGVGLHLAQVVANKYGTEIRVRQDVGNRRGDLVWTEFSVEFLNVSRGS